MSASTAPSAKPPRVLAVASHPIQYQAPWFRALAAQRDIDFSVLFIEQLDAQQQGRGFGVAFTWDVPLLEGYRWQLAPRVKRTGDGFLGLRLADPTQLLRELAPDVLLLTGWHIFPLVQLLIAAKRLGIPVVMRGESNALRERPLAARALHRLLLSACAAFLPIGQASRDFYRGYGIAASRLFDTPYFVDNERFAASAAQARPERAALRARWAIPQDAACFCYAGKLEPKKRILDLLDALRICMAQEPRHNLHLLVIGTGELMLQAQAVVEEHKLPVTFAGFLNQTEIPQAYAASDCLVLPSDFGETWGLVVNEAMACGLPAIVSDRVGCGPDLVTEGETGMTFPFGDTQALARKLLAMAGDASDRSAMGNAARERVLRSYSIERSVQGTLDAVRFVQAQRHEAKRERAR